VQERARETHRAILDAAARLFVQQGYDRTSVTEICAESGVSKGAFYHHFASKQDLFTELLDTWLGGLDAQIKSIAQEAPSVSAALHHMAGLMGQVFRDARGQLPLYFEFWAQARLDPAISGAAVAPYSRYRAYFTELIARGVASGELRPVDAALASQILVSTAVGLILEGLLNPDGADWGDVSERAIRTLASWMERDHRVTETRT